MNRKRFSQLSLAFCTAILLTFSIAQISVDKKDELSQAKNERGEQENASGYMAWRNKIISNQITGTVDASEVARINREIDAQAALNKTNAGMDWTELGPDNVGGRTRSILIDRTNSKLVFAGAVSGGIWKSTTAGSSWTRMNDQMSTLNISCLAQTSNGDIFAGTGESAFGNGNASTTTGSPSFDGTGVFKSTDGGSTFTLLPSTDAALGKSYWANTNDMVAHPTEPGKIFAGNTNGIYITNDGGTTWTKAITNPSTTGKCMDLDISKDGSVIAAVIGVSIYISVDGGALFNRLTPTTATTPDGWAGTPKRISLAIANSNSNYIYAMAENQNSGRLLSIVQSKDKGQSWTRIVTGSTPYVDILSNAVLGQGWWNNVTAVDPDNEGHAYFGGIDLYDWTSAGGLVQISNSQLSTNSYKYVHADNHAIVWDLKTTPATMYLGNDGGVFKSIDKGKSFYASNHGYNVTQFYAVSAAYIKDAVRSSWVVGGGAQDNGSWVIDGLGNTPLSGVKTKGGDGFYAELSQKLPGYCIFSYTESDLSSYLKFTSRDNNVNVTYDQTFYNDRIAAFCKDSGTFNTPFTLWETSTNDSNSLFLFAAKGAAWIAKDIYKDLAVVPNWYRVAQISGEGSCVDISRDGNTALIGTSSGLVYKVDSILTKGVFDSANGLLSNVNVSVVWNSSGRFINGVSFSKTDKNKVVVTLGNYGNNDYVYYSTNFISSTPTFISIQGNLPKIPVYDAEIVWDDANSLVLATERGMFVSKNFNTGSPTYAFENSGMANVPVFQLRQYKFNNWPGSRFYIATHGRGFYVSTTYAHTGVNAMVEKSNSMEVYPNPAKSTTTISFNAKHSSKAVVSIYNYQGQLLRSDDLNATSGKNNYSFYVNELPNGNYIVVVSHDGIRETKKLLVVK
ncbi:MAG: T9SS type A sorting domain-containing protein [Bacteroidetes bacterium]|nr:T9SS type A sorting domain-containing protein [Bacteroidota bacterium]